MGREIACVEGTARIYLHVSSSRLMKPNEPKAAWVRAAGATVLHRPHDRSATRDMHASERTSEPSLVHVEGDEAERPASRVFPDPYVKRPVRPWPPPACRTQSCASPMRSPISISRPIPPHPTPARQGHARPIATANVSRTTGAPWLQSHRPRSYCAEPAETPAGTNDETSKQLLPCRFPRSSLACLDEEQPGRGRMARRSSTDPGRPSRQPAASGLPWAPLCSSTRYCILDPAPSMKEQTRDVPVRMRSACVHD